MPLVFDELRVLAVIYLQPDLPPTGSTSNRIYLQPDLPPKERPGHTLQRSSGD
jgi:hypothetical protein